jgi:hypothetical protein
MATVVGTLMFEMAANVARLQGDMAKANQTVSSAMQGIKGSVELAKTALAGLGVAFGAHEFVEMVKNSIEAANAMHELAVKTGQTVEAISSLELPARNPAPRSTRWRSRCRSSRRTCSKPPRPARARRRRPLKSSASKSPTPRGKLAATSK